MPHTEWDEREMELGDDDLLKMLNEKLNNLLKEYNPLLEKEKDDTVEPEEMARLLEVEELIVSVLKEKLSKGLITKEEKKLKMEIEQRRFDRKWN